MQISILPVSIPSRPGAPSVDPGESLAFSDVLDGLPTDPGRPDSAKVAEDGSSDLPDNAPKAEATDKVDLQADAAPLVADPAVAASVPSPIAVAHPIVKMTLPVQAAPPRAGVWASQTEMPAANGPDTGPVARDTGGATVPVATEALPPAAAPATKSVATLASASLPPDAVPQAKPQAMLPETAPVATDGLIVPEAATTETPAPHTLRRPGEATPVAESVKASRASPSTLTTLPPTEPRAVSAESAPMRPEAPPEPMRAMSQTSTAVQPALPTGTIVNTAADPAPTLIGNDQKPAAQPVMQAVSVSNTDPFSPEGTVPAEDALAAPVQKPAGQPSRTAAIQMLTRDDLTPVKAVEHALIQGPILAPRSRPGYQGDPTQISTPQPKVALGTDPAASVAPPAVHLVQRVFFPDKQGSGAGILPVGRRDPEAILLPIPPQAATPSATVPHFAPPQSVLPKPAASPPLVAELATDGFRPMAGPDMLLATSTAGSPPSFAGGSQPLPTVTPQTLGQAIVQVVQNGEDRQIDLALRPEELGRLRFEMSTSGDKVHVTLFIERPEALDLIRRHAEHLLNDLRQAGFSQTSLSFGDWSQRESQTGGDPAAPAPTGDTADTPPMVPAERFTPVAAFGRLDIRL